MLGHSRNDTFLNIATPVRGIYVYLCLPFPTVVTAVCRLSGRCHRPLLFLGDMLLTDSAVINIVE